MAAHGAAQGSLVIVDGDATIDWGVATGSGPMSTGRLEARVGCQAGGAVLLADLLTRLGERTGRALAVHSPAGLRERAEPTWTLWSRIPDSDGWRVERLLGFSCRATGIGAPEARTRPAEADIDQVAARLVVLHDAGLGYRDNPDLWPAAVTNGDSHPWVVLGTTAPVADSRLLDHLTKAHDDRLLVVVDIEDLRRSQVQISRGLSWERTAQDLVWELAHNPDVATLAKARHVIVTFGDAGAVVATRTANATTICSLVFDAKATEGDSEHDWRGVVPGAPVTLEAVVACAAADGVDHEGLVTAAASSLTAARVLTHSGYALDDEGNLAYPFDAVIDATCKPDSVFATTTIPDPARLLSQSPTALGGSHGQWTILEAAYPSSLSQISRQAVIRGAETVLTSVPHGRFGRLFTVDRHEIEALRAIRGLMEEYCTIAEPGRPVSIAVFGPPGSGKSFGVAQVAGSLLPGRIQKLEFNLSQFESPDELIDALHQVRDAALTGKIPLVFWDEFDTSLDGVPLGWLRYFLAPMQDGAFRQGQLVHPIGRAIFVFAGGTAANMRDFGADLTPAQLRSAKKPDFVSRLRGYLDVLGPNPQGDDPGGDRFHELRRAILLDSLLRRKAPQLVGRKDGVPELSIDPGVLTAFLKVPSYRHGARSMEAIIDMSHLSGQPSFLRSSLPSEAQLDLHVDGRRFLALVQRIDLSGDTLERLARAAHDVFRANLVAHGYRLGPVADETAKVSPKLCDYDELSEADKEQNRANVRDIPNKLAHAGYVMLAAKSEEVNAAFHRELIDQLARQEHERWMAEKLARGWAVGTPTDELAKRHEALLPWEELSESQRDKDRAFVTGIADILRRCGYAVLPVVT